MSNFSNTYLYHFLIGLDQFGAAILFNRNDITISTICGLVLNTDKDGIPRQGNDLDNLKLHRWQVIGCKYLGKFLNFINTDHCNKAIKGDANRATQTILITCANTLRITNNGNNLHSAD